MYRWKGPNKSNDITISSQGRYREDDIGVSVYKTQDITLLLELKFHQIVLALFNQCNELKSWEWVWRKLVFLPRHCSGEHKKNGTWVGENQRDSFSLKLILKLQYIPNPQLVNDWDGVGRGFDWDLQLSMFCSTIKSSVNRKQRVTLPTLCFLKSVYLWISPYV